MVEEYFEDDDYLRYFHYFSDPVLDEPLEASEYGVDELLEDDEIDDAEEGFLRGYER